MKNIYCIGHITHDRVVTPEFTVEMPGGTAWYFGKALAAIAPERIGIVTAVGADEAGAVEELRRAGVDVTVYPSEHSVYFENIYGQDMDDRKQRVRAKAAPFRAVQMESLEAPYFHLGTLLADDFDAEAVKTLARKGKVALDVQGYLRRVEEKEVVHQDFAAKREILPYVDILKANEVEMEVLTESSDPKEAARILAGWGVKEVVLTLGAKGSLIYADGVFHEIPAYRPTALIDATGCGDTYMAGYLLRRSLGDDIEAAGRYAAAMCALKLGRKGPLEAGEEEIARVMAGIES